MVGAAERKKLAIISIVVVLFLVLLTNAVVPSLVTAQTSSEDETEDRLARNAHYREQIRTTFEAIIEEKQKIVNLEEQKENTVDEEKKQDLDERIRIGLQKIEELEGQFRELDRLNMELYKVEPELEQRIYSVEKILLEKYHFSDSPSYVGETPVEFVLADFLRRNVVIIVNEEKATEDGSNLPKPGIIDGVPVVVEYGIYDETSCNSRTSECRPLIGGISVADKTLVPNSVNTLGYKAFRSGHTGFVTAGHAVSGNQAEVVQPHNDASKRVGFVWGHYVGTGGDFAFVKTDPGITVDNKIYLASGSTFSITGKTAKSQQMLGTTVTKSGVTTFVQAGEITSNNPGVNHVIANVYTEGGDSGAPVFYYIGGTGSPASLYGVTQAKIFVNGQWQLKYYPWDIVNNMIGASPP